MLLWPWGVQYCTTISRRSRDVLGNVRGVLDLNYLANWIARNKKKKIANIMMPVKCRCFISDATVNPFFNIDILVYWTMLHEDMHAAGKP